MVELLYGELPASDAETTRAHLDGCDECADAYARISMGKDFGSLLDMVEPPVSVLDSVMAVARETAAHRGPATEPALPEERATPPRAERDEEDGAWAGVLRWIGSFAMRPQLAMAMSLLLIVGMGMWYLPTLRQGDPADSHAIVDPAPGDEVGPSASLEPAQPLDLEANPRTGRILPREDPPPRPTPRPRHEPQPVVVATTVEETPAPDEPLVAQVETPAVDTSASNPPAPPEPSPNVIDDALPDPRIAVLQQDLEPGESSGMASASTAPRRPTRAATRPAMAYEQESAALPPTAAPAASPTPQEGSGDVNRYERGLRRYRERNYRGAADDFESVIQRPGGDTRRLIPSALHHLARSERSARNCPAAVRSYERLLRQHPSYSGVPEAMIEAASCYERMGRLADARRWLERARTRPAVAARANRQLAIIAQRERASDRVPAAADSAEAY